MAKSHERGKYIQFFLGGACALLLNRSGASVVTTLVGLAIGAWLWFAIRKGADRA